MPLVHPIWEFFDPEDNHTWQKGRAQCKVCGTGIYGSSQIHKRDMAVHLKEHPEQFVLFNKLKKDKEAQNGHINKTVVGAVEEKEIFRQALLDLKDSMRSEVIDLINPIAESSNIPCSICGKIFKKTYKLEQHTRFIHGCCNTCGYRFLQPKDKEEHKNVHNSKFNCSMCAKRYSSVKTLIIHTASAHEGKTLSCDHCSFRTAHKYNLAAHVERVHNSARLNCQHCDRFFSSVQVLMTHIARVHNGKNLHCDSCDFKTAEPHKLTSHRKGKHEGDLVWNSDKRFSCPLCSYQSKEKCSIRQHIKVKHEGNMFECDLCHNQFNSQTSMRSHRITKHLDVKTYECNLCEGKVFKAQENLKRHIKVYHNGWHLSCNQCDFTSTTTNGLKRHKIKEHNEPSSQPPMRCEFCSKEYLLPSLLTYHMRLHTGYKPHKCDVCEKTFSFPVGLRRHKKTHDLVKEKPFSCNQCKHKFADSSHLKRHFEGKHLNIKHTCDLCDKKYTSKNDLRKHVTAKHSASSTEEVAPKVENKLQPGYKCKLCEKDYHHKGDLNRHIRTKHTSSIKDEGF